MTHIAQLMEKKFPIVKRFDTFDGAKPRFLNRGKKRRSVSTLSIPRALVLSAVEGSARGVEWVDFANTQLELERTFRQQLRPLGCKKCLSLVKKVPIITSIYE